MLSQLRVLACAAVLIVVEHAWALPPRREAAPLSSILQALEQRDDLAYFKKIEWNETGRWEIEYQDKDGRRVELTIDPVTGDTKRR